MEVFVNYHSMMKEYKEIDLESKLVGNNGRVTGADISEVLLNFAKSKFCNSNNLEFNICDIQNRVFEKIINDKTDKFFLQLHPV